MSNKPTTETVTLSDESGIEILVNYTKAWEDQKEECHGSEIDMSGYSYVINSIELVIAGEGINITKQVSLKQYRAIMEEVVKLESETV